MRAAPRCCSPPPIRFSHRRHDDDLDGKVQIAHQFLCDDRLLGVLLSHERELRMNQIKQYRENGSDATKVTRARGPFELVALFSDLDPGRETLRINVLDRRSEDVIDADRREQIGIAREVARVTIEVLALSELRGIDEDRNDHLVSHPPGFTHQAEMALVECAHCRDKTDGFLLFGEFGSDGVEPRGAGNYFHMHCSPAGTCFKPGALYAKGISFSINPDRRGIIDGAQQVRYRLAQHRMFQIRGDLCERRENKAPQMEPRVR